MQISQYSVTGGKVQNNYSHLGASTVANEASEASARVEAKANKPCAYLASSEDLQGEKGSGL